MGFRLGNLAAAYEGFTNISSYAGGAHNGPNYSRKTSNCLFPDISPAADLDHGLDPDLDHGQVVRHFHFVMDPSFAGPDRFDHTVGGELHEFLVPTFQNGIKNKPSLEDPGRSVQTIGLQGVEVHERDRGLGVFTQVGNGFSYHIIEEIEKTSFATIKELWDRVRLPVASDSRNGDELPFFQYLFKLLGDLRHGGS